MPLLIGGQCLRRKQHVTPRRPRAEAGKNPSTLQLPLPTVEVHAPQSGPSAGNASWKRRRRNFRCQNAVQENAIAGIFITTTAVLRLTGESPAVCTLTSVSWEVGPSAVLYMAVARLIWLHEKHLILSHSMSSLPTRSSRAITFKCEPTLLDQSHDHEQLGVIKVNGCAIGIVAD